MAALSGSRRIGCQQVETAGVDVRRAHQAADGNPEHPSSIGDERQGTSQRSLLVAVEKNSPVEAGSEIVQPNAEEFVPEKRLRRKSLGERIPFFFQRDERGTLAYLEDRLRRARHLPHCPRPYSPNRAIFINCRASLRPSCRM